MADRKRTRDGRNLAGRASQTLGRVRRPFRTTPQPSETSRLLQAVCCSSLLHDGCRTASLDTFPDNLPSTFEDAAHYVRTFLPLVQEEAREAVKSGFCDARERDLHTEAQILSVEDQEEGWVQLELLLGRAFGREAGTPRLFPNHVTVLTNFLPPKRDPFELLKRKLNTPSPAVDQRRRRQHTPPAAVVAIIVAWDPEERRLILKMPPHCDLHASDKTGCCHQAVEILQQFREKWWLISVGGLVTQQRECDILHSVEKIPVLNAILHPDQHLAASIEELPRDLPSDMGDNIHSYLQKRYDESQQDAILLCTAHFSRDVVRPEQKTLPVLLIQGPPGTGKTLTVEGILNLWHLVQFQRYYRRVISQYECSETAVMEKAELVNTRNLMQPRILVCAPSNAAVDELLQRIMKAGFMDSQGKTYRPNLIRVGAEDAPYSEEVRPVLLETLVSSYIALSKADWAHRYDQQSRRVKLLEQEVAQLRQALLSDKTRVEKLGGTLLHRMETLDRCEADVRRLKLVESLLEADCTSDRHIRESLELSFLDSAEMVFTTLSSSGKKVLSRVNRGFETVLIDEAAQASEVSTLQPLVYGCQQCVLVGDPQQLPATIMSQRGRALKMERSLFGRLQEAGAAVKLLQTQYRMHPYIRSFPSSYFYSDQLQDGANVLERASEPFYAHDLLKPYVVFDVTSGMHQRQANSSFHNQVEADLAVALFKELSDFLQKKRAHAVQSGVQEGAWPEIGILTPYRGQVRCLNETFVRLLGADARSKVNIMTVDSCQGKELDIIIFSCVRGSPRASSVGFMADVRRMNVAITRAKKALWILGNLQTLVSHPAWAALVEDAMQKECVVVESTAQSLFPHQNLFEPSTAQDGENQGPRVHETDQLAEGGAPSQTAEACNTEAEDPVPNAQAVVSTEVGSVSTAASATMQDSGAMGAGWFRRDMLIRPTGPPQLAAPTSRLGSADLRVVTSEGVRWIPVQILYPPPSDT